MACWIAFKGSRSNNKLPFESGAIKGGKRLFKTEEDIWKEILWFANKEFPKRSRQRENAIKAAIKANKAPLSPLSLGADLWTVQFCDTTYITEDWMFELIDTVNTCIGMDIPIANDLMACPIRIANYYSVIKQELVAISEF